MGEGADYMGDGQQEPSGWGPPEPQYVGHSQYQPAYVQQPQPRQAPPPQQPAYVRPAPRRSRRSSKVEQRLRMVQYFEELLSSPVFDDPNDPYASAVQEEIFSFAQRRIDELFGEPVKQDAALATLTAEELGALKVLAQKMLSPEEGEEAAETSVTPAPRAPAPPPPPAPRGPRGCANPACGFPPHGDEHPCGVPLQASEAPPQRPQPAPQPPPPPPSGPQVIARPTPAQRAALDAARARPQPPPEPPPQMAPRPAAPTYVAPAQTARQRRGRKTTPVQPAAPPARPPPPPPRRYAMPLGNAMTMVTGQKAEEQIQAGGTVMSETFVKASRQ